MISSGSKVLADIIRLRWGPYWSRVDPNPMGPMSLWEGHVKILQRRRPRDGRGNGINAPTSQGMQGTGRALPCSLQKEHGPATLDLGFPAPEGEYVPAVSRPACGSLLRQPQQITQQVPDMRSKTEAQRCTEGHAEGSCVKTGVTKPQAGTLSWWDASRS